MITFKEFLLEHRAAPLYHGTSLDKAIDIINDNALNRSRWPERGIDKRTVSLTRNLTFARNWVRESGMGTGVIFALNQNKIRQRFKMAPYNYFGQTTVDPYNAKYMVARDLPRFKTFSKRGNDYTFENQFEEAVLQDIKPITKYIDELLIIHTKSQAIKEGDFIMDCEKLGLKVRFIPQ